MREENKMGKLLWEPLEERIRNSNDMSQHDLTALTEKFPNELL